MTPCWTPGRCARAPRASAPSCSGYLYKSCYKPLPLTATGPPAGGCTGTLTHRGQSNAGSTCAFGTFEASAKGLAGVVRAAGVAAAGLVPALLYDRSGNVVGSENPQVLTNATQAGSPAFTSPNTPEGFKGGNFSSVIELF